MAENKSTTLTVRILPEVKEGLRAVAEQERRSLANMIEIMIRDYCRRHSVDVEESSATTEL